MSRLFGEVSAPVQIARYAIVRQLGRGGGGVVFEARDPRLNRNVAIKVLHAEAAGDSKRRVRLLREARALARLSHVNIVPVYDVGTYDDGGGTGIFVVMELVDGVSLWDWLTPRRPWREILRVFMEAGRGLAAAHAAGIVHRDFKPHNVQVGARAMVLDFGLAGEPAPLSASTLEREGSLHSLTRTGAVLGTPRYMAPEQHTAGRVDARSDQFSFCLCLWEALSRRYAFEGATVEEIASAKIRGMLTPPPVGRGVPTPVWTALRRGLDPARERRWPTMEALLRELESVPRSRSAATVLGVLVAVTATAAAAAAPTEERCGEAELGYDARQPAVVAALAPTDPSGDRAERLDERLAAYADAWSDAADDACRRGSTGATACLRRRAAEFHATVDLVVDDPDAHAARSLELAARLGALDDCVGAEDVPNEGDATLREQLAEAEPLLRAGACTAAHHRAASIADAARSSGANGVLTEALLLQARASICVGEWSAAEEAMTAAYFTATKAERADAASRAAAALAFEYAQRAEVALASRWLRHAESHMSGSASPRTRGEAELAVAHIAEMKGDKDGAREHYLAATELLERALGPRSTETFGARIGAAGYRQPREAALEELVAVAAEADEALGARHAMVATAHNAVGKLALQLDRTDQAADAFSRAAEIWDLYPETPDRTVALTQSSLAAARAGQRRFEEARAAAERAATAFDTAPSDPVGALVWQQLAVAFGRAGDHDRALDAWDRAIAHTERAFGGRDVAVAQVLRMRAVALRRADRGRESLRDLETAAAILGDHRPPEHPELVQISTSIALTLVELGRFDEAVPRLERAVPAFEAAGAKRYAAQAKFALARAVRDRDPDRATALASSALDLASDDERLATQVAAWLHAHPARP